MIRYAKIVLFFAAVAVLLVCAPLFASENGEGETVLARVDEHEITTEDVDFLLSRLDPQMAAQFATPQGRERLLEELINQHLFYLWAIDEGLDQEEEFLEHMERIRIDQLKQYAIETALRESMVTDDEISAYYEEHHDRYRQAEKIQASHILVEDESLAMDILAQIEGGLPFDEAAGEFSQCPSAQQGGDLGVFERGQMVPEFEEAAFALQVGEVSGVVETQFGFHIIKLFDRQSEGIRPLEEVRMQIERELQGEKLEELYYQTLDNLKERYEVEILDAVE